VDQGFSLKILRENKENPHFSGTVRENEARLFIKIVRLARLRFRKAIRPF
jgi:hypothetical protein